MNAGRYVLGNVLENEFGFDWVDTVLTHSKYNIRIDLASIDIDESEDLLDASDVIEFHFDAIKSAISQKRIRGVGE